MNRPTEPQHPYHPFERKLEDAAIGNPDYVLMQKEEGIYGLFYNRDLTTHVPVLVVLNITNYRTAVFNVLARIIEQQIKISEKLDAATTANLVDQHATQLTNGVVVMTYLKLRSVNSLDNRVLTHFRFKPTVPHPFEVPTPYAAAITQLGKVKISGLNEEIFLSPDMPNNMDEEFGCPAAAPWDPLEYSQTVEYAKKIGLKFSTPDLTVKMGSTWWTYRPSGEGRNFTFQCPYPEENFTNATALLAALFCAGNNNLLNNPIINLDLLGANNYGSMIRGPPPSIAVDVYYAIVEIKEITYSVAN